VTFQVDSVQTNSGSEASQAVLSEPVCTQRLSAEFSAANDNHSRDFVNAETSDHAGVLQQQADITESQVRIKYSRRCGTKLFGACCTCI
jgi:hypothetical protein